MKILDERKVIEYKLDEYDQKIENADINRQELLDEHKRFIHDKYIVPVNKHLSVHALNCEEEQKRNFFDFMQASQKTHTRLNDQKKADALTREF